MNRYTRPDVVAMLTEAYRRIGTPRADAMLESASTWALPVEMEQACSAARVENAAAGIVLHAERDRLSAVLAFIEHAPELPPEQLRLCGELVLHELDRRGVDE